MSAWFGDAAPLSGAFLPVPVEVVDHVLATQPPGPWPRWMACLDLRRWQDRALGTRTAFPSRRALATRWGWDGKAGRPGEGAVRGLLASEAEWADPRKAEAWAQHPASGAGLKAASMPPPKMARTICSEDPPCEECLAYCRGVVDEHRQSAMEGTFHDKLESHDVIGQLKQRNLDDFKAGEAT